MAYLAFIIAFVGIHMDGGQFFIIDNVAVAGYLIPTYTLPFLMDY